MILNCVVRELQARRAEDLWKAPGITSRPGLSPSAKSKIVQGTVIITSEISLEYFSKRGKIHLQNSLTHKNILSFSTLR